jgi:multiple sugar transport system permease protein
MPMISNNIETTIPVSRTQPESPAQRRVGRVALWLFRWVLPPLIGLCFLAPIIVIALKSVNPPYIPQTPGITLTIPPFFSNYPEVFRYYTGYEGAFGNSLVIEAVAVPLTLLTASLAGFAMAQLRGKLRQRFVLFTVALMLVPVPALWIPRFMFYRELGLIDQLTALMIPSVAGTSPFFILIFYWTFRRLPQGLFEAAKLDGANLWQVWRLVALPLAKPSLAVVAVLAFTFYWNDYMGALMFIRDNYKQPVAFRMQLFQLGDDVLVPLQMAGVIISSLPVVIMFLLVQRYFWPEGRASINFDEGVGIKRKKKRR